ncbi:uncharacterized protein TNCV_3429791 [Trichonephila clavipes]|nr:uncharacterized protein TNCV_3429791 [Trichonephila clavipes]
MHVWRPLWSDWLAILAIVEDSKVIFHGSTEPPKSAFAFENSVVMSDFTNSKKANMHLMYGAVNDNGREALRLHQEHFPSRCMSNHKIFQRLHRKTCENGSFDVSIDGRGRSRTVRQTHLKEVILNHVDERPDPRAVACRLYVSKPAVWRVLLLTFGGCNF